jgi:hypothetical protein
MTNRRSLLLRILADAVVSMAAIAGFFLASHSTRPAWLIAIGIGLIVAAAVSGYLEPSGKTVWIHAPIIMAPELIALPFAFATCRGFECAGITAFLFMAGLFTLVLVGISYCAFFIRRRITRPGVG